jgi:class 3 adenylate cyclase/tetratricopeptide (TPR) repeat protein
MECPNCSFQNPNGIKYCGECGFQMAKSCPECGYSNPPTFKFCGQCKFELNTTSLTRKTIQKTKSERKYVTVIFSDLAGYTSMTESLDPEEVRSIVNTIFNKITAIIETHDGFIERYIGDSVMAVFGIPRTHEDDPARAVRTAIEIHEAVNAMNSWVVKKIGRPVRMHTGINTGLVVTGTLNPDDGSHGLTGLDVNIASRLEGIAADDEIIVGYRTYQLTRKHFNFEELKPVAVKGKKGTIRIFKVLSKKTSQQNKSKRGSTSVFVGREKEVSILHQSLEQLFTSGSGSIISITGEPGIGKSKLYFEYKKQLNNSNLLLLHSYSSSFSRETSYGTFLDILKDYAGIEDTDNNIKSWDKLEVKLNQLNPDEVINTLPYLATILSIQVKGRLHNKIQFLDAETLRNQIFRAFYLFVKSLLKKNPFVLVFEDFHWADDSTVELLIHLLPLVQTHPFQIIFICRNTEDNPLLKIERNFNATLKNFYTRINLHPLGETDVIDMAVKKLGIGSISSQLCGLIQRKCEGNPLYIEELIRTITTNDLLEKNITTGQYTLKPLSGKIQIPDSLRGLVSASVDKLDKNIKEVLKTASAIGRSFLYRLLKGIESQSDVLDVHLSVLVNQNLIREKTLNPELEYYFYHDLIKDAVYESILLQERKELHLKIAETIELLFKDQIEKFFSLLSYHYAKASEWNKASLYFRLAGDQANRIAGDSEALAHYKKAISAHEELFKKQLDDFEKAVYTRKLGEIYFRRGENDKALESLKKAFGFLGIPYPFGLWKTRIGIFSQLVQQLFRRFSRFKSTPLKTRTHTRNEKEISRILESIAWIDMFINQERLAYDILTGLNFAEKMRDPNKMIMAFSGFAFLLNILALHRFAAYYHNLSQKILKHAKDDNTMATFYVCKATHYDYTGDWDKAISFYEKAAKIYEDIGHIRKWGSPKSLLIFIYLAKGEYTLVDTFSRELIKIGFESGNKQLKGWGLSAKGAYDLRVGDIDAGIKKLVESKILLQAIPDYYALIIIHIDLTKGYIRTKSYDKAVESIKKAEALINDKKLKGFVLSLTRNAICDLYLKILEESVEINETITPNAVKKYITGAIHLGRKYKCGLPSAYRVTGGYYRLKNHMQKALSCWEKGLEISQQLGARYEEGLIYFDMGRHLNDTHYLNQARRIFSETGSKYELSILDTINTPDRSGYGKAI